MRLMYLLPVLIALFFVVRVLIVVRFIIIIIIIIMIMNTTHHMATWLDSFSFVDSHSIDHLFSQSNVQVIRPFMRS